MGKALSPCHSPLGAEPPDENRGSSCHWQTQGLGPARQTPPIPAQEQAGLEAHCPQARWVVVWDLAEQAHSQVVDTQAAAEAGRTDPHPSADEEMVRHSY